MRKLHRRILGLTAVLALAALPALAEKKFLESDDAKEKDEPHTYLPDYDKLTKGKDADWVYFPEGSLSKFKTASVAAGRPIRASASKCCARPAARWSARSGTSPRAPRRTMRSRTLSKTSPRQSPRASRAP